jgi:hypothetical protein
VEGGAELTCSWVVAVGRLLKETFATAGRDVLQPAWVSPKMERREFLPKFPWPFLGSLTSLLLQLSMQCLARYTAEVAELREELTRTLLAVLKPNRMISKRMDTNYSSFHLRIFLGLSNPQGQM